MHFACARLSRLTRLGLVILSVLAAGRSFAEAVHFGHGGGKPVLSCSAEPAEVTAGEPVTLSARGMDLPGSNKVSYQWEASAGSLAGDGTTVTVDTKGLEMGKYSAGVRLVDTKKVLVVASCTTSFSIISATESPLPTTIACSADRAAISSGDQVNITASATGKGLTYSYSSTNGQVVGHGASALLSTNGATPGGIMVTCMVMDEEGKAASATASVVVATPGAPPPSATAQRLCELSFERDRRRPDRVDNEAKGCLDEVALDLGRNTGAKLLITGHHDGRESARHAAMRALNAEEYLTKEKGIDGGRVRAAVSAVPGRSVDITLVPEGATVDSEGVNAIDEARMRWRP